MIKVKVDRKKWYRGQGHDKSCLLLPSGEMCCIGFLAVELGCQTDDIQELTVLEEEVLPNDHNRFASIYEDPLNDAYTVNDSEKIDDTVRESQLQQLGKLMNVKFTFIN